MSDIDTNPAACPAPGWLAHIPRFRLRSSLLHDGRFHPLQGDLKAVSVFLFALFFLRLTAIWIVPFTDTTEARYAEIARKMVETGDWITPQFAYGVPFWGKPPLHTWMSALGMEIFGVSEFGGRILIFAAACGLLMLLYRWCAVWKEPRFALISVAVLAGSALFWLSAGLVMTDLVMVLGTSLSMIAFWNVVRGDDPGRIWGYLVFVGVAIGLLAKGPTAAVLTVLPIGLWILIGSRWSLLHRLPWVSGLALMMLIVMPWYVAAEVKTPGFLRYFLIGEHIERFLVSGWQDDLYGSGHGRAMGTIWVYGAIAFLPWSPFALILMLKPTTVLSAFRRDDDGWRSYLLLWALAPLILFTAAANILIPYVLPGLPAASVLLVQLWTDVWGPEPTRRSRQMAAIAGGTVLTISATLIIMIALAPDAFSKQSHRALVTAMQIAAPGATLDVVGRRSYSAEFYTAGQARTIELEDLPGMRTNGRRDALSIETRRLELSAPAGLDGFRKIGRFGRQTLLIETWPAEAKK